MYPEHMATESGPHLFGYIQSVSLYPMIVTMWMEADLPLYMDMARTGKIARKVFHNTGPILYYSLVVSHPSTGKAPIAMAEMLSNSHSVPTLTNFLMNFRRDITKLYKGKAINPAHLEIDLSWASVHSCLHGLFDKTVEQYFHRSWRIVNYEAQLPGHLEKQVVHFCTSHLMHTVSRKLHRM